MLAQKIDFSHYAALVRSSACVPSIPAEFVILQVTTPGKVV